MPKGTNSFDIPVFVAGSPLDEQLSASKMNGILDALDILRLRDGRGYTVSYSGPGGTTLDINPGAGFLSQTFPFQLIDVSTEIERRVRVKMGTIADEVAGPHQEPIEGYKSFTDKEFAEFLDKRNQQFPEQMG